MAISIEQETLILKVTVGLFNAAPGGAYLTEMSNLVEGGMTIAQLADVLAAHSLFTGTIMAGKVTTAEQVEVLMDHFGLVHDGVTGSAATQAEDYFTARIEAGDGFGSIVYDAVVFLSGSVPPEFADAAALLANKAAVAEAYSSDNSSSNLAVLQGILSGVTADGPSTPEEIVAYLDTVLTGDTFTLTTDQDTVVGGAGQNTIKGIFGGTSDNTLTAGDDIDGGAGNDTLELTAQGTTASSGAVSVKNVERITIKDVDGATFNSLSVEDDPSITFTNTVAGNTSSVTQAGFASVIGLQGAGNLTVDYFNSSGTEDVGNISLNGVGTDEDDRSTVNVSDGNTVEGVIIATTGTNFVSLNAGTAASEVVLTGDGTNDFDLSAAGAVAASFTIDASETTGTNTFDVGTKLSTGDSVLGGTGEDTLTAELPTSTTIKATLTGVETLNLNPTSATSNTLDLDLSTGVETINLTEGAGKMSIRNADSALAAVNVLSMTSADEDLVVDFRTGEAGDVAITLGSADTTEDDDFSLGAIDVNGANSLAINTIGSHDHSAGMVTVDGDLESMAVDVGAETRFNMDGTEIEGDLGALTINVGEEGWFSGNFYTFDGDSIGDVTLTADANGSGNIYVEASGGGSIGDVTIDATGEAANWAAEFYTVQNSIGDISLTAHGDGAYFSANFTASGGSVGNITALVSGNDASGSFSVSAGDWEGTGADSSVAGNIGNIDITVAGNGSEFSGSANTSGGDIGNITMNVGGNDVSAGFWVNATAEYRDDDNNNATYSGYQFGGNIGDVTMNVTGDDAYVNFEGESSGGAWGNITVNVTGSNSKASLAVSANYIGDDDIADALSADFGDIDISVTGNNSHFSGSINASGGNIGNVNLTIEGGHASGLELELEAQYQSGAGGAIGEGGNIGDIVLNVGDDSIFDIDVNVDGELGTITGTIGDNASGLFYISGDGSLTDVDHIIGDVSFTLGESSEMHFIVSGIGGVEVGNVEFNIGQDTDIMLSFNDLSGGTTGGEIGDISVTATDGGHAVYISSSGGVEAVGTITLTGGESTSSAGVYWSDDTGGDRTTSIGGVDASAWLGELAVDLTGVIEGTEIKVGDGGSWVIGAEGGDTVYLGDGIDVYAFDATTTDSDEISDFTVGEDSVSTSGYVGTATETDIAADAAATTVTDDSTYIFADGGDGTGAEAIVDYNDFDDVGAFIAAAFSDEAAGDNIVTYINDGAGNAYIYNVIYDNGNAGGGAFDADAITLIGIVHADDALTSTDIIS